MKTRFNIVKICLLCILVFAYTSAARARIPMRPEKGLEEAFIWKASDELKLEPAQKKKFTEVIQGLGQRKRKVSEQMADAIQNLDRAKGKAETERALKRYRSVLNEYHAIQVSEFDQLKALLGDEKLARYLVVKREITENLKGLLSNSVAAPASPPPVAPGSVDEKK